MHVTKCVITVERDKELTLTRYLFIFVTEILNKREILEVHGNFFWRKHTHAVMTH